MTNHPCLISAEHSSSAPHTPRATEMLREVLESNCGLDSAEIGDMLNSINESYQMEIYVEKHHSNVISQVTQGGHFQNYWRTRYYTPDGIRRTVYRKTRSEIIRFLYEFYRNKQGVNKTFATVFKELLEYKSAYELCSDRTIYGWERYYTRYLSGLGDHIISKITDDDLNEYIISHILPDRPKVNALHHVICCLKKVFWFARKKGYISTDPEAGIDYKDYRRHTDRSKKREEDTYFTAEETEAIRLRAWECIENPRALIILLCIETGMRADEPVALHIEDIHEGYIEIHRQQIRLDDPKPYRFVEVDYTKDTRNAADPCRYFPITPRIQEIINAAKQLPGESKYLFHDAQGNMIKKDSYELYLRRFVTKLGIKGKTNNHAFRKGLNTNVLIPRGVPVNERAALLGHSVRTNERNYSPRKSDALERLRTILSDHENGQ